MYRTCVIHNPIPCTVMDEKFYGVAVHDKDIEEYEHANDSDQEADNP